MALILVVVVMMWELAKFASKKAVVKVKKLARALVAEREPKPEDYWTLDEEMLTLTRHHIEPRKLMYAPLFVDAPIPVSRVLGTRITYAMFEDHSQTRVRDDMSSIPHPRASLKRAWRGQTVFLLRPAEVSEDHPLRRRKR